MLAVEDARTPSPATVNTLTEGLRSADTELRRWAVRGLGRLESESAVSVILPALADVAPIVRAEAANAAGQAVLNGDPAAVRGALVDRLPEESDPFVRGVIAETLGRLRHGGSAEIGRTAALLSDIAGITRNRSGPVDVAAGGAEPTPDTWLGVARGYFFLVRQPVARGAIPAGAVEALRVMLTYRLRGAPPESEAKAAQVRRLAGAALAVTGRITVTDVDTLLADPDPVVRREGAAALSRLSVREAAAERAGTATGDADARVRIEAVRALIGAGDPGSVCPILLDATGDANPHVALLAISGVGSACAGQPTAVAVLDTLALALPDHPSRTWHRSVRALNALTQLSRERAQELLPRFLEHGNSFVRGWAVRVATRLGDAPLLQRMASDTSANVRSAAVDGLSALIGHDADTMYIAQLADDDSQLLQAAAAALEGGDGAALPFLLDAFDRVSRAGRETWRDSRRALLRRIREFGNAATTDRIRPYLTDYDPAIAALVAEVIEEWTGEAQAARPQPGPRLQLPALVDLQALAESDAVIEMADGGIIALRLLPFEAPTNAWRFARLARQGYYDGLTFHRVEPNFVIQGGSPAANEFAGDGPFTRDELGLVGNDRGTVGLSTRGRDTGDAQFYVNLIDNTRLDHDYTVFAEVVSGMEVVDRILEGAVMRRVEILER